MYLEYGVTNFSNHLISFGFENIFGFGNQSGVYKRYFFQNVSSMKYDARSSNENGVLI